MKRTIALLLLLSPTLSRAGSNDGRFDIYWIDVEGGAATLMVTPTNESILIDTGNPGLRDPNRIAHVATKVAGLQRIDHLITTHYHRDHHGGASTLATLLPIGTVYDNGVFEGMPDDPGKDYFEFKAGNRVVINPGDSIPMRQVADGQPIKISCVATRKTFATESLVADATTNEEACASHRPKDRDGSDNANSVASVIEFGAFRFYDAGDLTWNQEMRLVCPKNLVGEVDVYQVTHHGLDTSNNPVVLETIKPRVAIMNNGHTKGCLPEVFANLQATKSLQAIYQVHKNLRPDGSVNNVSDEFIANHKAADECDGNYIKLSVAPDSKSYTVSIPASGHEKTYQTKP
ncbi:MAG: MBL fold metallo-hydrolase [Planctomycetaceae bacterium]|nr:MBL fold metallo-hydrolase [Planctomycetaceae bacterium]